ncbi:RDD family protein [Aquimarina megaterium]|uniref:RDD family protein n=1 Tax=Aquimarina megaterium TaxID=1443666 RepID=UPI000470F60F|nr:RDD family protein [Aquimarina megaterium]
MIENPQYAKFWDRVGAYIIDGLIVGTLTFALNYLNITNFKSFLFYLPITVAGILYKPYMESYYGATLGKMALNLKVTDLNYNKIDFNKSFLRSLIIIIPSLIYIPVYYFAFDNPEITKSEGFMEFSVALASAYPTTSLIINIFSFIFIVDLIVLLSEGNKKQRSLKDFIAKTYVIKSKD